MRCIQQWGIICLQWMPSALCTSHKWTIIIYVLLIEIDSWHHFKCHAIQQECSCGLFDHSMYHFTVYCHVLTHWQNTISLSKCTLAPQWHNAANQTLSFINFRLQLKTHYIAFSTYKHKYSKALFSLAFHSYEFLNYVCSTVAVQEWKWFPKCNVVFKTCTIPEIFVFPVEQLCTN